MKNPIRSPIAASSLFIALLLSLLLSIPAYAQLVCTTIRDGALVGSDGAVLQIGYDDWGYNYEAHMFNGDYVDNTRGKGVEGVAPGEIDLMMKWNEAWMSNKDCDGDGKLDRHLTTPTYIGSGAWLTNHQSGKVEVTGKMRKWTYFIKIIAVPADATKTDGTWYTAGGTEIGPDIWGQFAIVQEVSNDPSKGEHGILYRSPTGPGLGNL